MVSSVRHLEHPEIQYLNTSSPKISLVKGYNLQNSWRLVCEMQRFSGYVFIWMMGPGHV